MPSQGTATSPERRPAVAEIVEPVRSTRVTRMQYARIVEQLKQGRPERKIAESEQLAEPVVRLVRVMAFEQKDREISAIGVCFGGFLDRVRSMHREIESDIYEELSGAA